MSARAQLARLVALAAIATASCTRAPGHVELDFSLPDGALEELQDAYLVAFLEERTVAGAPGPRIASSVPVPFTDGAPIHFGTVPNGDHRVAIVELRTSSAAGARVLYYGISEPFRIEPELDDRIAVSIPLRAPPRLPASNRAVIIPNTGGFVNHAAVALELHTDTAVKVRLSNDPNARPGSATELLDLHLGGTADAEGLLVATVPWNLDAGSAAPCVEQDFCPRSVYAQLIDAAGYESASDPADVVLDTRAPGVIREGTAITPSVARAADPILVTLTLTENVDPLRCCMLTARGMPLAPIAGGGDTPTRTLAYELPAAGTLGAEGEFSFQFSAADRAGNSTVALSIGTVRLDRSTPEIIDLRVAPDRIGDQGGTITATFRVSEPSSIDFSAGELPVRTDACTETNLVWQCALNVARTPELEGVFRIVPLRVQATDAAGNIGVATSTAVVDFENPYLLFAELDHRYAKEGDPILLTVTVSEPQGSVPELRWAGGADPGLAFLFQRGALSYVYGRTVPASGLGGEYRLESVALEDEVHNRALAPAATSTGTIVFVDVDRPRLTSFTVLGPPSPCSGASGPARARPGETLALSFEMSDALPLLYSLRIGSSTISAADCTGGTTRVDCNYLVRGDEVSAGGEGTLLAVAEVVDAAGNRSTAGTDVVFDFRAPAIVPGSVGFALIPAATNVLSSVEALGPGTTARLSFTLDEPVALPSVSSDALVFHNTSASGTSFVFEATLSSTAAAGGEHALSLIADDCAGNRLDTTLPSFTVDVSSPSAPDVESERRIVFRRAPWGRVGSSTASFSLAGGPGAVEASSTVIAYHPTLGEVGRARAAADGSFAEFPLATPDTPYVSLEAADAAGNTSARVPIRDAEWTATLIGKTAGSAFPNPHRIAHVPQISDILYQRPGRFGSEADTEEVSTTGSRGGGALITTAHLDWEEVTPTGANPAPRSLHALAYDAARGRTVLFGGFTFPGGRAQDTWEWDGRGWTEISPSTSLPAQREGHAMVYDAARGRALLYGGYDGRNYRADTWEWDGESWIEIPTSTAPGPRAYHALAYDTARERVVLFGGYDGTRLYDQTWEWDGVAWSRVTRTSTAPSARFGTALAYDRPRGQVVLFGGEDLGAQRYRDTWSFDGGDWRLVRTATSPPALSGHDLTEDFDHGELLLFGGFRGPGRTDFSSETWIFDGVNWRRASTMAPSARNDLRLAGDRAAHRVMLFGGAFGAARYADSWWWDGSAWVEVTPSAANPGARQNVAVAYDSDRDRWVLFGGQAVDAGGVRQVLQDTWEWDGARWAELTPAGLIPPARHRHAMAYDAERRRVVMYGGAPQTGNTLSDTWTWDGVSWTQVFTGTPSRRSGHAMAYDPDRHSVLLFGGSTSGTGSPLRNDLFEWNGTTWNPIPDPAPPTARWLHAMAYDEEGHALVVFGGSSAATRLNETNLWTDLSGWTVPAIPGELPSERTGISMVHDAARGRLMLLGGNTVGPFLADTWIWDGEAWSDAQPFRSPPVRASYGMAYDTRRGRALVFGGASSSLATRDDAWALLPTEAARTGQLLEIDWASAGVPRAQIRSARIDADAGGHGDLDGAELSVWSTTGAGWTPLAANNNGLDAPAALSHETGSEIEARSWIFGRERRMYFLLATRGRDFDAARAAVALDDVELTVRYRR